MNEIKVIDQHGIEFLIQEEGMILHPYRDSAGIWTIGVGNTYYESGERVKESDTPITKERAIELFKNILEHFERTVWSATRDDINQNQFNALLSLCYNIGTGDFKKSTVLKLVNQRPDDPRITEAFYMWRFSTINGVKKPILAQRRIRESKLYFT